MHPLNGFLAYRFTQVCSNHACYCRHAHCTISQGSRSTVLRSAKLRDSQCVRCPSSATSALGLSDCGDGNRRIVVATQRSVMASVGFDQKLIVQVRLQLPFCWGVRAVLAVRVVSYVAVDEAFQSQLSFSDLAHVCRGGCVQGHLSAMPAQAYGSVAPRENPVKHPSGSDHSVHEALPHSARVCCAHPGRRTRRVSAAARAWIARRSVFRKLYVYADHPIQLERCSEA